MKHRILSALLLSTATLALSGCIAGFTYNPGANGSTYVFLDATTESNFVYTSQILGYPIASTGNPTPAITLNAPADEVLIGAATDAGGNVYTLTQPPPRTKSLLVPQINVYDPTSSTPSTPVRTITIPLYPSPYQMSFASFAPSAAALFAVDPSGNIYVAYFDLAGTMVKYGPTAADVGSTPATPALTLTGITNSQAMTTDSSGNLYDVQNVFDANTQTDYAVINVYRAGFTTSTPARTINPTTNPGTNNTFFYGITVDGSGNVYATTFIDPADDPEIAIFSPTANVTPTTAIVGDATTLTDDISGIALDSAGNIYVRDGLTGRIGDTPTIVDKFAANASGPAAPLSSFNTGIVNQFFDTGLAIH